MMTWERFDEEISEEDERLRHMNKEYVYDSYVTKIKPYLPVIAEFLSRDKPATDKQLKRALGISGKVFNACRDLFEEFGEYLSVDESFMHLKAQIDLQKGLNNTNFKNPKLVEMQLVRYDEGYKPKGKEVELTLPKVEITYTDARVSDEALDAMFEDEEVVE